MMAQHDVLRISREVAEIQKGKDLSIAVACDESNMRRIQGLIVGPPGTPYEYGFFEFSIKFPPDYPTKPPKVEATTTNQGRCRFNPNIYAGGKVCLSILGTWQGERGEEWSSVQGLESVLLSIQSLMSSNPYENEPGFEDSKGDKDKAIREAYCAKIRHETLRIAVIQKLESIMQIQPGDTVVEKTKPEASDWGSSDESEDSDDHAKPTPKDDKTPDDNAFKDLEKQRFLWYYESYLTTIEENMPKNPDGTVFLSMPFESSSNGMAGKFQYGNLGTRLVRIKEALNQETENWSKEGLRAVEKDLNIAYNLQTQFDEFATYRKQKNLHNIDVSLLDDNPFVWKITYFGRSGSNLDGGMFQIHLMLSTKFPAERPRAKFITKMYHHRVSKDGVLCYFAPRTDEVKHHIEAMVLAIEEVSPPYDPRAIVHPEATKLLWGTPEDQKKYNRAQRRCACDSMEE